MRVPADSCAELVLPELGLGFARIVGDEVVGVQNIVSQKIVGCTVVLVGARLDGRVHRVPGRVSVFRGKAIRLDLEFFHRIHGRNVSEAGPSDLPVEIAQIVVHAIQQDVVGVMAPPLRQGSVGSWSAPGTPPRRPTVRRVETDCPFSGRSTMRLFSITCPSDDVIVVSESRTWRGSTVSNTPASGVTAPGSSTAGIIAGSDPPGELLRSAPCSGNLPVHGRFCTCADRKDGAIEITPCPLVNTFYGRVMLRCVQVDKPPSNLGVNTACGIGNTQILECLVAIPGHGRSRRLG